MNTENEINLLKERNKRVEADKAWETSWSRKIIIAILTYITISSFFFIAELSDPFKNAVVPTTAFIISTSTLSLFKKIWLKKFKS